jgi:predicted transporter
VAAVAAGYVALFALIFAIAEETDIVSYYEKLAPLLAGGMAVHWAVALVMLIWGAYLARSASGRSDCHGPRKASRAWMALATPCPVCVSAVLMSTSCLVIYFPDDAAAMCAGLCAAFLAIAAVCGAAFVAFVKGEAES